MEVNIKRKAEKEGERPTSWSYLISHKRGIPSSQSLFGHFRLPQHTGDRIWCACECVCMHSRDLLSLAYEAKKAQAGPFWTYPTWQLKKCQWRWPDQESLEPLPGIMTDGPAHRQNICKLVLTTFSVFYSVENELNSAQVFHLRDMQISAVCLTESKITLLSYPFKLLLSVEQQRCGGGASDSLMTAWVKPVLVFSTQACFYNPFPTSFDCTCILTYEHFHLYFLALALTAWTSRVLLWMWHGGISNESESRIFFKAKVEHNTLLEIEVVKESVETDSLNWGLRAETSESHIFLTTHPAENKHNMDLKR